MDMVETRRLETVVLGVRGVLGVSGASDTTCDASLATDVPIEVRASQGRFV
jgi:hypothetical protein